MTHTITPTPTLLTLPHKAQAIDVRSLGASVDVIIVVEVQVRLIVAHLMEVAIVARANVAYHSFPTADLPSFDIQILTLHYVDLHARI